MKSEISVVILTSRGPRHSYFCQRLEEEFAVRGIVVDDRYRAADRVKSFLKANEYRPLRVWRSLLQKRALASYEARDRKIEERYFPVKDGEFPRMVPVLISPDPNSNDSVDWIRRHSPDVIAVFGTRLISDVVLSLGPLGALNMHTGLSPFYRGGQCTFWCLYQGDLEHVGVTIHHLTSKIDGGDIVYTERPEIVSDDTVRSLECKLVRLGTEKMIRAIRDLSKGCAPRIPQREKGKLYLSKMFTLDKRLELEKKLAGGWLGQRLAEQARRIGGK